MRVRTAGLTTLLACALAWVSPALAAPTRAGGTAAGAAKAQRCAKGFVRRKGRCVCPKGRVRRGRRCVKQPARKPTPTTGSPSPGAPTAPPPADGPPFSPPGRDLTGQEAANALLKYLANSTFTDCVTGWPTCAVETRYGHLADGTMYYCRLTNVSGADIINSPHAFQIIGADQKADGSWAVTLQVDSYGNTVYYTWSVTAAGVATGLYWGPGQDPRMDAGAALGPLQWVRGGRTCAY